MRFARKLAKIVVVLALAAAALGGAAALGSTLFPSPPRDAADFAARANAGAEADSDRRARKKPGAGAKARARYVRALDASCRRQKREFGALGQPATLPELVTYLEELLVIARPYEGESLGVKTPPAFRDEEARYEALGTEGMDLIERMLVAARRGDLDTVALLRTALIEVAEQQNEVARRLGAQDCVAETPVAAY